MGGHSVYTVYTSLELRSHHRSSLYLDIMAKWSQTVVVKSCAVYCIIFESLKAASYSHCDPYHAVLSYRSIFRRHRWKRFRLFVSMLPLRGPSVCLTCLCTVLKRSKISSRFLLHTSPCLSQIGEICRFLCSVISQGKVVALDSWGGKWNYLSMTHRLTTNCAKNYCNRIRHLLLKLLYKM